MEEIDEKIREENKALKGIEELNSVTIFQSSCESNIETFLDSFSIEVEQANLYCKLIENSIPSYFMPLFSYVNAVGGSSDGG